MLPISADAKYEVLDNGVIYGLRYLTGTMQEEYYGLMADAGRNARAAGRLQKIVSCVNDDDVSEAIMSESCDLELQLLRFHKRMIDMFVVSIDGQSFNARVSDQLLLSDVERVSAVVQSALPVLSGSKPAEELKN